MPHAAEPLPEIPPFPKFKLKPGEQAVNVDDLFRRHL